MLLDCKCGATNRIPGASAQRHRCGKCKHVFTPAELTRARHEPPPPKPEGDLLDAMMSAIGDTLGGLGADRVEWDGGFGFDIPPQKRRSKVAC